MSNIDDACCELKVGMPPIEEQLERCREELRQVREYLSQVEQENTVLTRMFVREYNNYKFAKSSADENIKNASDMHNDFYAIRNLLFHSEPKPRMSKTTKQEIISILRRNNVYVSEKF